MDRRLGAGRDDEREQRQRVIPGAVQEPLADAASHPALGSGRPVLGREPVGSARSSANRGRRASQAASGDLAAAIVAWTSATKARTTGVSRTNSGLMAADSDPTEVRSGRRTVRLTHPERVLFPRDGVTKGDLAEYYVEIGDAIVPHLRERPFTLKRYPRTASTASRTSTSRRRRGSPSGSRRGSSGPGRARANRGSSTSRSSTRRPRSSGWCR